MQSETKPPKADASKGMTRRTFAVGAFGSLAALGLGGITLLKDDPLLRPPGGQDGDRFLGTCVHCERCREICPQHAIKPTKLEQGLISFRTPQMDYKRGWCDFCASTPEGYPRCSQVCPVNAFQIPPDVNPDRVVIGKAMINPHWCLAYNATGCHTCVDACPYGAMGITEDGIPFVIEEACNGCGACEHACISLSAGSIVAGATDRAITVHPISREEII